MVQQIGAAATAGLALPSSQTFATVMQRFLAQVVDALVAFGVFYFTGNQVARRFGGLTDTGFEMTGRPAVLAIAITAAVLLAYYVFAEALVGATLGKVAVGIRVVNAQGAGRLSFRKALVRNLLRFVDAQVGYLVGAIVIMVTDRRQRLGDLAAGSIVTSHETPRARRVAALIVAAGVAVGGVVASYWLRGMP